MFTLLDLKRPLLTTKGCVDWSGIVGGRLDDVLIDEISEEREDGLNISSGCFWIVYCFSSTANWLHPDLTYEEPSRSPSQRVLVVLKEGKMHCAKTSKVLSALLAIQENFWEKRMSAKVTFTLRERWMVRRQRSSHFFLSN